jgi:CDP-diacylglycerol--glycerol-3-phosphate 3-phosphatidyltransferase
MTTPGPSDRRGGGCVHRECAHPERERLLTHATVITLMRTAAALVLALAAAKQRSLTLLVLALGVYWVLDIVDGLVARALDQETRIGAVLDVLGDRLSAACFYVGYAWYEPTMAIPIGIYLAEFMVVDLFLSLAFLAWPVASPNYFYVIDERIWRWNWSHVAKVVNGGLFAILVMATRNPWLCGAWASALFALKCVGARWLTQLPIAVPGGCAVDHAKARSAP